MMSRNEKAWAASALVAGLCAVILATGLISMLVIPKLGPGLAEAATTVEIVGLVAIHPLGGNLEIYAVTSGGDLFMVEQGWGGKRFRFKGCVGNVLYGE